MTFYGLDDHVPVPVTVTEWATQFEIRHMSIELDGEDPWRVAWTELPDGAVLSTVFLGIDHNFFGSGPPILFETMLFGSRDEGQWRYATWDEALAGHNAILVRHQ